LKLCDIGNTNFSFDDGKIFSVDQFDISSILFGKVYYISVNHYWEKRLEHEEKWINLRQYVNFDHYYESMGIDRIMCCEAVENALIIDAGSAITIDIVRNGRHQGGCIYPGFSAMEKAYKNISPRLDVSLNFDIDLATMPKNTEDAISFGVIAPLVSYIRSLADKLPIIITGGDAEKLHTFLPCASVDNELVFKGMRKIIKD
jgi:type III pantothenate kinase